MGEDQKHEEPDKTCTRGRTWGGPGSSVSPFSYRGTPSFEDSDGTTINSELGPAGAVEMPEITPFGGPSDVSTRRRSSTPAAPTGAFGPLPGGALAPPRATIRLQGGKVVGGPRTMGRHIQGVAYTGARGVTAAQWNADSGYRSVKNMMSFQEGPDKLRCENPNCDTACKTNNKQNREFTPDQGSTLCPFCGHSGVRLRRRLSPADHLASAEL